jgi:peptide chain release factor subunit 1
MRANDVTAERLRELAGRRPEHGKVLSLFLDLDPSQFGTIPARASEIRSLLDDAGRKIEDGDFDEAERKALRIDLRRIEEALPPDDLPDAGAEALAVFASGPDGLFEILRLPRPVPRRAVVESTPHLAPLVAVGSPEPWCAALVTRGGARYFLGPPEAMVESIDDGFEERGVEIEGDDPDALPRHLRRAAATLFPLERDERFARLVVATATDLRHQFEELLHPYVRERLVGPIDVDAAHATEAEVSERTSEVAAAFRERQARELRDRAETSAARGDGRAIFGLPATLEALVERRVEALLLDGAVDAGPAPGVRCPRCGWLGADPGVRECPVDGTATERVEDILDDAVRSAIAQDAQVVRVPEDEPIELGIAALLRF